MLDHVFLFFSSATRSTRAHNTNQRSTVSCFYYSASSPSLPPSLSSLPRQLVRLSQAETKRQRLVVPVSTEQKNIRRHRRKTDNTQHASYQESVDSRCPSRREGVAPSASPGTPAEAAAAAGEQACNTPRVAKRTGEYMRAAKLGGGGRGLASRFTAGRANRKKMSFRDRTQAPSLLLDY